MAEVSAEESALEANRQIGRSSTAPTSAVCVCACTYKRPKGLEEMLRGLERQRFSALPSPDGHVVIADNEGSNHTREICKQFERRSGLPVTYVHEPTRGISFARNACLDNIPLAYEFFAFIDDDEVPEPDWLEKLMEAQARTGADVVQGSVIAKFCPGAPRWLAEGNFFGWPRRDRTGTRPHLEEDQELPEAYTGNVLVRRDSVAALGLRFDPAFALTGGGDSAFFMALHTAGNRIVYAPSAVVTEVVPPERATLWYRLRLEYRIGISPLSANTKKRNTRKVFRRLANRWRHDGPGHVASGVGSIVASAFSGRLDMDSAVVALLRIAFGAGRCARLLGLKYHIYR